MTPQEMFEYKTRWKSNNPSKVIVDIDSDVWGKDWCRDNIQRHEWSFDSFAFPDDSHLFYFEHKQHADNFLEAYIEYFGREKYNKYRRDTDAARL